MIKSITKMLLLLAASYSLILPLNAAAAVSKIVYGPSCTTYGGDKNCDGWKITIEAKGWQKEETNDDELPATNLFGGHNKRDFFTPSAKTILSSQLITDGMAFSITPKEQQAICGNPQPSRAAISSPNCSSANLTIYMRITDPQGITRSFIYILNTQSGSSYIFHPNSGNTGGAVLNEPENGSVTINGASW